MKTFRLFKVLITTLIALFTNNLLAQNTSTLTQVRLNINSNESNDRRVTRTITEAAISRELFGNSYASVPISWESGNTTWDISVATDPLWNRLCYGDYDKWLKAYGDWGSGNGQFRHPHGIDRNPKGKIFVADTGNNRVVILKMNFLGNGSSTEDTYISYLTSITGLSLPYDVAWDDNGTTYTDDDYLWVVESGNHRILKYNFYPDNTYALVATYGSYGNSTSQFAYPKAIAVGRTDGLNDDNIYVADTGNQRIVRLKDGASGIAWKSTYSGNMVYYSSVESDWYGGVWITDMRNHKIIKRDRYLMTLDTYGQYGLGQNYGQLNNPTDFSIYFTGIVLYGNYYGWVGHDAAFGAERWGDGSGATSYMMGTSIKDIDVLTWSCDPGGPACIANCWFIITDYSKVTVRVYNDNNQLIRTIMNNEVKSYGEQLAYWGGSDDNNQAVPLDQYYFKVDATSLYSGGVPVTLTTQLFWLEGAGLFKSSPTLLESEIPTEFKLLANYPNPFNPRTVINYHLPKATHVAIKIFDVLGREVATLIDKDQEAGVYEINWGGRDNSGNQASSGLYIYSMRAGEFVQHRKMVLLK